MDTWVIAIISMSAYLVLAFGLGLAAGRGKSFFSVSDLVFSAKFLRFSFLKSVSYQPPPLNLKFGAEISLFRFFPEQAGQSVKGASFTPCSASIKCPQSLHLYSYIGISFFI